MTGRLLEIGPGDAALLSELHGFVFQDESWSEADWRALLGIPGAFGWLLSDGTDPVAFLLGRHAGGEAEVLTLGVRPEARRSGHAVELLQLFKERLRQEGVGVAYLEVAESNEAALALYRKAGFFEVGKRDGYYRRGSGRESALILRWSGKKS